MTFQDFVKRISRFWWIIVVTTSLFILVLLPWLTNVQYAGAITVGLNLNDPSLSTYDQSQQAYVDSLDKLSLYLQQRLSSLEIQSEIARNSGIEVPDITPAKPFYDVINQGAGFVTVTNTLDTKEKAQKFIDAVQVSYNSIVGEWNQARLNEFRITPQTNFVSTVTEVTPPQQLQLFSPVGGIIIGVLIAALMPLPKPKTQPKTKNS